MAGSDLPQSRGTRDRVLPCLVRGDDRRLQGRSWFRPSTWTTLAAEGAGFAGFAAGELGQGPHDPDIAAIPDLDSLTVLPWRQNIGVAGRQHLRERRAVALLPAHHPPADAREARARPGYVFKCGGGAGVLPGPANGDRRSSRPTRSTRLAKPCYDLRALHPQPGLPDHAGQATCRASAGDRTPTTTRTPTASSRSTGPIRSA